MDLVKVIESENLNNKCSEVEIGDYVKAHLKIKEGNRERIQVFEGTVLKRQNGGVREDFPDFRKHGDVGGDRSAEEDKITAGETGI